MPPALSMSDCAYAGVVNIGPPRVFFDRGVPPRAPVGGIGTRFARKEQWRRRGPRLTGWRVVLGSAALAPSPVSPRFSMTDKHRLEPLLQRVADALERLAPPRPPTNDLDAADAFVWHAERDWLEPVPTVNRVEISLLKGIDRVRDILIDNTERFAKGLPANNVLLWGARGMGKSSLVKAAHASINVDRKPADRLKLIEIHREDIESLP